MESPPKPGIEFQVFWYDQDVVEFLVSCSNGSFSGSAKLYLDHDDLSELAKALSAFPSRSCDRRDFKLGTFEPTYAGGGLQMRFYCRDAAGHAGVDVKLRGHACTGMGDLESVALRMPLEAAAIDVFVWELEGIDTRQIGATAFLSMAT